MARLAIVAAKLFVPTGLVWYAGNAVFFLIRFLSACLIHGTAVYDDTRAGVRRSQLVSSLIVAHAWVRDFIYGGYYHNLYVRGCAPSIFLVVIFCMHTWVWFYLSRALEQSIIVTQSRCKVRTIIRDPSSAVSGNR